jgi:hypothetical protein
MNRKISLEQEIDICDKYISGVFSQKELGEMFNLKQSGVFSILKRNQIKSLPKYRLNTGKLKLDISFFEKIDEPKKAYWLGYLMADGSINKNNSKCTLISKDIDVIKKFKEDIDSEHKININVNFDKRTNKTYYSYSIQITNTNFVSNLIKNSVTKDKTDFIDIPKLDDKLMSYFFAGLFDGDGSVGLRKNGLRISLISTKEILLFLQEHLLNNFNVNETKLQKVTKNKNNIWKMNLYKDSFVFLDWIYFDNNFNYLDRKYNIYEQYKTNPLP